MSTLILVEHDNNKINPSIRNVVTAAQQLDAKITLLVIGYNCEPVAKEVAQIPGVASVCLVDASCYQHQLAENVSKLIANLAGDFSYIVAAASTFAKNILPRVAALLDVGQISDIIKIVDNKTFIHPIYAGNALETVKVLDSKTVLTIRPTAFDAVTGQQEGCQIERINQIFESPNSTFVSHQLSKSERPDLSNAKIIVSGGRGLQSAEKFKLIEELADVLQAAVGASRAAVDAGFVPNEYQVGQTGKIVAPTLYFAIGISGAVQHLAGMKDAKVIVAINKDADAPIFQIATYGLVGDLFTIVPQLIEQLKKAKE